MIVGLTGGIGSGKTTVLNMFKAFGIEVFIADEEAKRLMHASPEIKAEVIAAFGEESYRDGMLNRDYLSSIVFNDKKQLDILNSIIHPRLRAHFKDFVKNRSSDYFIYEAAILYESGSDALCDYIITVTAPLKERIQRVMKRDQSSEKAVLERIQHQLDDSMKIKKADFVVSNNYISSTRSQVYTIHKLLIKLLKM